MDYFVGIHAASPVGALMIELFGKIGGASAHMEAGGIKHPVIIARDIEWALAPGFVRMTHIRNPGAPDPMPREIVVPSGAVLAAIPVEAAPAGPQHAAQQTPPTSLH